MSKLTGRDDNGSSRSLWFQLEEGRREESRRGTDFELEEAKSIKEIDQRRNESDGFEIAELVRNLSCTPHENGVVGNGKLQKQKSVIVKKLGAAARHMFIDSLIKHIENDNLKLLQKQRERIDRVNVKLPTIEVRYKNLSADAICEVVEGKPLPTLWNVTKSFLSDFVKVPGLNSEKAEISILKDISGIIKPSRMTLLLGPPGCGKSTFLQALAGKLDQSLQVSGEVTYNGYRLDEFVPEKTSAYVSQHDMHIPEMTVRETLDFSARLQGVGSRAEILKEVRRREIQAGIVPDHEIDTYMKAISMEGLEKSLQTDYILKIMGLDVCADTMVGDAMIRGISGGQKKRVTTGEMIVGPAKALFLDEISTGLDSSTTFQIIKSLQQFVHIMEVTLVVSLLQPAPETYDLFDDIILMAEGKVVYHGPRSQIINFFQDCGFRCPERKGEADFLQEVLSRKDQEQYWYRRDKYYTYVSVDHFIKRFKAYRVGKSLDHELSVPFDKSECPKNALSFRVYSLAKWELLKACMAREVLLMKRNSFVYIFKGAQLVLVAIISMTVFLRTRKAIDVVQANIYLGAQFHAIMLFMINGIPELFMTISRLPIFYKQRDFYFYPAWAYAIPSTILKMPISFIESFLWTALTYYVVGYSPEVERFFRQFLLLFALHQMSTSLSRFLASSFRSVVVAGIGATLTLMVLLLFSGFILPRPSMPGWLKWGFWASPLSYAQIGITVNEFLAPRWRKMASTNTTIGEQVLTSRGLNFKSYFYGISVGALFGYTILLNIGFTLALSFLRPPGRSRAIISREKLSELRRQETQSRTRKTLHDYFTIGSVRHRNSFVPQISERMILPFTPLAVTFQDLQYYVETPPEMLERGYPESRLQLLHDITGAFRPGILTALMGVSGAGKTTLMDVLSGRKTGGTIEGEIRIGGYPKVQETYARVSGYCEQIDIHSPQITVEESVFFSASLRLPPQIDEYTRTEFVNEVLETIELDALRDTLVGIPGVNGLSTEQRKRLTIAVELVANPSIIFIDEPTSGLDARAAAIVMRAVKNVSEKGRTVVCTIHQPSIDIFEAFDEIVLMKTGGRLIYSGPLGRHSSRLIKYFESIPGVPRIKDKYNPATWMLEVTSSSTETQLGVNFADLYRESSLYNDNLELVKQLSTPPQDSEDLYFPTRFPQNSWGQFKACLWKQYLSYWRSPAYNLTRLIFVLILSATFAALFWQKGTNINNQQDLFNMLGSMFVGTIFLGMNNLSSVIPFVSTERTVLYREKFAGMYSSWAYSFAQMVIEIPYIFLQVVLFVGITYPTIGFYWTAQKFLWYFYIMFCTLLYCNFLGMVFASLTPTAQVASILASSLSNVLDLFSGFIIPGPEIPKWWIWLYYINPTSWTLNGLFSSQYGDIQKEILVFGQWKPIASFIDSYFGYRHDRLVFVAIILAAYPVIFGSLFAYCIEKLNFQRR